MGFKDLYMLQNFNIYIIVQYYINNKVLYVLYRKFIYSSHIYIKKNSIKYKNLYFIYRRPKNEREMFIPRMNSKLSHKLYLLQKTALNLPFHPLKN